LTAAGIPFDSLVPDIDETKRDSLIPAERVLALAEDKAKAASELASPASPRLVLAADTLVCLPMGNSSGEEQALGKPRDNEEARIMLRRLAGRSHMVRTGLVLLDRFSGAAFSIRSDSTLRFAPMREEEIESYLASGEWEGVAGAYRIQGLASFFIDRIEGSWTGVVGLPMRELYVILQQAGCRVPFARMGN
jgi:septum formation protein